MKKVIIIFSVIIIFLGVVCTKFVCEKTYLQNGIDDMFDHSYQSLILNMWNMSEHDYDESQLKVMNTDNTKYGEFLSRLFQYTSYNNNYELGTIVQILDQSSGNDSCLSLTIDKELYDKLAELNGKFDSISLAESVRKTIEKKNIQIRTE